MKAKKKEKEKLMGSTVGRSSMLLGMDGFL